MLFAIFREEAAGKINKELIIRIPTHWIEIVTMTAIIMANKYSYKRMLIPLLLARDWLILARRSLLKITIHKAITTIKTMLRVSKSDGLILNKSPIR